MAQAKKKALGKGLGALLGDSDTTLSTDLTKSESKSIVGSVINIKLEMIEENPFQPRTEFSKEAIEQLSASIQTLGIIQPITVRNISPGKFQLISGERRFRASKLAGLKEIPAYVRLADDQGMLEMALVENIQREELDAIEIAISYNRLIDECNITQEELSERVGKKRTTITNYLRLLKLPPEIQHGIRESKISMGHARALIAIENIETQLAIFYDIVEDELSVRQVETIVKDLKNRNYKGKKVASKKTELPENVIEVKNILSEYLDSKIDIKRTKKGKGSITISFNSDEDFERILKQINK